MDNSYGMLALQKANLYILQEIDRICTKYKINYTLDSGTLLGAIRHGGFIPWDDDADIAMTRANWYLSCLMNFREERFFTILLQESYISPV